MKKLIQRRSNSIIFWFTLVAIIGGTVLLIWDYNSEGFDLQNIIAEVHGLVFDIVIFGVILTAYEARKQRKEEGEKDELEKRQRIERYKEELDDYRGWNEPEAAYRVAGIIRRLKVEGVKDINYENLNLATCPKEVVEEVVAKKIWLHFLKGADLEGADLGGANLREAHLEGANLREAHLEGANLLKAHLEGARLEEAHLEGANLYEAHLEGAKLRGANLGDAKLGGVNLEGAFLERANLEGAFLERAHLEGAFLNKANLRGTYLLDANLKGANLYMANLEGANLSPEDWDKWFADKDYIALEFYLSKYNVYGDCKIQKKPKEEETK